MGIAGFRVFLESLRDFWPDAQVSTTPRGALVIDTAAGGNLPEHHPQAGDLDSDIQRAEDSDLATWVLEQAVLRQTSALVRLSAEKAPQPIFVHPFADVLANLGAIYLQLFPCPKP